MTTPIYLNNAATSWPKAPGVAGTIAKDIQTLPVLPGRDVSTGDDPLVSCRWFLAKRLAVPDPNQIILTSSATLALNIALLGLNLKAGQLVVTTQSEHNSVLRPLYRLKEKTGIRLEIIGHFPDGSLDQEAWQTAMRNEPALVVLNHASNVTGLIQPARELFELAHQWGAITLLDASQSLGHIDVHPLELHADLAAFPGHKGLLGPNGTGGLYVNPEVDLEPVLVGGTGIRSDLPHQPLEMPARLEAGTPATALFHGWATALEWLQTHESEYHQKEIDLFQQLVDGMTELAGVRLFGLSHTHPRVPVLSLQLNGWEVEETGYVLAGSFGIECRTGLHCAPLIHQALGSAPNGTVRLSPSGFNNKMEIHKTLEAFTQLTQTR